MGRDGLRGRATWQDYSGASAGAAEKSFYSVFADEFKDTEFRIRAKPQEFANIYLDVALTDTVASEIYQPDRAITKHGITPDYAIDNTRLGKRLYVEVKRQDGWVEGKNRSAGRGNAHERSCKYFTPGLLKILREAGNLGPDALPFWTVFQGDITRDPCRVRETTCWYGEYWAHVFMWRDARNAAPLVAHFNEHLKKLLL
jgi:hypothetical protein